MATVIFSGYFALGTGFDAGNVFHEVSGGSYVRIIVNNSGTYQTGTTQTISTFAAATSPSGLPMRLVGIFDASTNGNLLAWSELTAPLTQVGTALPSTVFNIALSSGVIAALANTSNVFQAGSQIGTCNGNPLVAGVTLIGGASGALTYEPAQGTQVTNPIFYNAGTAVGRFSGSDFIVAGTLYAASATVGTGKTV